MLGISLLLLCRPSGAFGVRLTATSASRHQLSFTGPLGLVAIDNLATPAMRVFFGGIPKANGSRQDSTACDRLLASLQNVCFHGIFRDVYNNESVAPGYGEQRPSAKRKLCNFKTRKRRTQPNDKNTYGVYLLFSRVS